MLGAVDDLFPAVDAIAAGIDFWVARAAGGFIHLDPPTVVELESVSPGLVVSLVSSSPAVGGSPPHALRQSESPRRQVSSGGLSKFK